MARIAGIGLRLVPASAVVALLGCMSVEAATLKLPDTPYNYTVIDQDLAAALQEFGANLGIKVNVSPEVKGRIQGRIPEGKAQAFLDRLATNYNLEWYYDGSVLYITSAKESRTQLLVLNPIGYDTLKGALDALQISDARYAVRPSPGKGVVMVSGPPRYAVLIEQTLAGLVAEEQAKPKPLPQAPKEAAGPKVTVLTVFRGSSTTILHDGRPERVTGPEADSPARSGPQPASNQPNAGLVLPTGAPAGLTSPTGPIPGGAAPIAPGFAPAPGTQPQR